MDALPDAPSVTHPPPKFVTGSLLRHILVMSGAGGIGLVAIFLADLANILFLSWLEGRGHRRPRPAMPARSCSSPRPSASASRLPPRPLFRRRWEPEIAPPHAGFSVNAHLVALVVSFVFAIVIWLAIPWLLTLLGATGRAHALGASYLSILMPSTPLLSLAITSAAVLRSAGDAGRAMSVTLWGAVANAILDPILIFGFDLGIEGAAYATTIARFVFTGCGPLWRHPRARSHVSSQAAVVPRRCPPGDEDRCSCHLSPMSRHRCRAPTSPPRSPPSATVPWPAGPS